MKNGYTPAAPTIYADMGHNGQREIFCDNQGLTKREHFVGLAMQGFIASEAFDFDIGSNYERLAIRAVKAADALLAELEKSE